MRTKHRTQAWTGGVLTLFCLSFFLIAIGSALAESGIDFQGTVLMVDPAGGKLSVKKEGGGTRFTFLVNDKTQIEGACLNSLKDVKKDDNDTVNHVVAGSQYMSQHTSKKYQEI